MSHITADLALENECNALSTLFTAIVHDLKVRVAPQVARVFIFPLNHSVTVECVVKHSHVTTAMHN